MILKLFQSLNFSLNQYFTDITGELSIQENSAILILQRKIFFNPEIIDQLFFPIRKPTKSLSSRLTPFALARDIKTPALKKRRSSVATRSHALESRKSPSVTSQWQKDTERKRNYPPKRASETLQWPQKIFPRNVHVHTHTHTHSHLATTQQRAAAQYILA